MACLSMPRTDIVLLRSGMAAAQYTAGPTTGQNVDGQNAAAHHSSAAEEAASPQHNSTTTTPHPWVWHRGINMATRRPIQAVGWNRLAGSPALSSSTAASMAPPAAHHHTPSHMHTP